MKSRPPLLWPDATRAAILRECARTDRAVFTLEDLKRRELPRLCRETDSRAEGSNSLRPTLFQLVRRGEIRGLGEGCYRITSGFQFPRHWRADEPPAKSPLDDPQRWASL